MPDIQTPEAPQQVDERVSSVVTPLTICEREGHEYQFGACVDCDALDPDAPEEDGAPLGLHLVTDRYDATSYAGMGKAA